MEILTNNVTEALFALISFAGEIPRETKISGINSRTIQNQLSICKKKRLLKIDKKHDRIRIMAPAGLEYMKNFSEEAYAHYMMISNNHQFRTEARNVLNQKLLSTTILAMIRNGYEIDNLSIVHESNNFGKNENTEDVLLSVIGEGLFSIGDDHFSQNGEVVPILESSKLSIGKKFYTSKYLKYGFPVTHRINFSNIMGIMLSEKNVYKVYHITEDTKIQKQAEQPMEQWIKEICQRAYSEEEFRAISGKELPAILYTEDTKSQLRKMKKLVNNFTQFHLIPSDPHGDKVIKILSCENWQAKISEALFGSEANTPFCDGMLVIEGTALPSWELLSCDYTKIKTARNLAGKNPIALVCFSWQKEIIKDLLKGMNVQVKILNKKQEDILFEFLDQKG